MSEQDERETGSAAQEAARLMAALTDWARDHGTEYAAGAAGASQGLADAARAVNDQVATESAECRYCPVCQVIHAVRGTSPEVRQHLALAATSLAEAMAAMLRTDVPRGEHGGVEKIRLDDEDEGGPG